LTWGLVRSKVPFAMTLLSFARDAVSRCVQDFVVLSKNCLAKTCLISMQVGPLTRAFTHFEPWSSWSGLN
jgi:hypothetical protein